MLSRRSDVTGVIDDSGVPWWKAGGYYDLHQSAPLYLPDLPMTCMPTLCNLVAAAFRQPFAPRRLRASRRPRVWDDGADRHDRDLSRRDDPVKDLVVPGYGTYASIPFDRVATPPGSDPEMVR